MEENCQYGIWKNHLPIYSKPCPAGTDITFIVAKNSYFQSYKGAKFTVVAENYNTKRLGTVIVLKNN